MKNTGCAFDWGQGIVGADTGVKQTWGITAKQNLITSRYDSRAVFEIESDKTDHFSGRLLAARLLAARLQAAR